MMWKLSCTRKKATTSSKSKMHAFPTTQLFILAICRICEPIAFMSIFPYSYYMVESFHISDNPQRISAYSGLLITVYTFAEFLTGVLWGRIGDTIGRKPALLLGLFGTALSMLWFGFATSFPSALAARALGGLLNGNISILQTTVAELVVVKEHQPRAYSIMPFVWQMGSIIGPALGGMLVKPCETYPWLFQGGGVFDMYPFLLPNLVCFCILLGGITVGVLFLEETHGELRYRRDYGIEAGKWILRRLLGWKREHLTSTTYRRSASSFEDDAVLCEDTPEEIPMHATMEDLHEITDLNSNPIRKTTQCFKVLSRDIIFIIAAYGILACHSISFDMLAPLFLSQPPTTSSTSHQKQTLPFFFTGTFNLNPHTIGLILAFQGFYSLFAQLFLFPFVIRRYGTLRTFRFVLLLWPLLYLVVPYTVLLPTWSQIPGVCLCLIGKITLHVIAFPGVAIMLNNAAQRAEGEQIRSPGARTSLGTINGVAASTASLARALGPAITGVVNGYGLQVGCVGLAWWVLGIVCVGGGVESLWIGEREEGEDL